GGEASAQGGMGCERVAGDHQPSAEAADLATGAQAKDRIPVVDGAVPLDAGRGLEVEGGREVEVVSGVGGIGTEDLVAVDALDPEHAVRIGGVHTVVLAVSGEVRDLLDPGVGDRGSAAPFGEEAGRPAARDLVLCENGND